MKLSTTIASNTSLTFLRRLLLCVKLNCRVGRLLKNGAHSIKTVYLVCGWSCCEGNTVKFQQLLYYTSSDVNSIKEEEGESQEN